MIDSSLHLEIEATNLCNTWCLHCPREALSRPFGSMDWQTYQTIMDKVMSYTTDLRIVFCGFGEPLLNPLIYEFISYVSQTGRTSIITNGSALTSKNIRRLIKAGLAAITISFNGTEKDLYELMMGGLDFNRGQENLKNSIEMTKGTQTHLAVNVSVTKQTQGSLLQIKRYLEDAGVKQIYFSKCHNRGGLLTDDLVCDTPLPPQARDRCDLFKNIMFVTWNGKVLSCYHDLLGDNVIGDITVESIETIQQRKNEILREGLKFDICGKCNDLYRYCDAKTPDGRALSDWIYDLYVEKENSIPVVKSDLAEWLFSLSNQEGYADRYFRILIDHIYKLEQIIETLQCR